MGPLPFLVAPLHASREALPCSCSRSSLTCKAIGKDLLDGGCFELRTSKPHIGCFRGRQEPIRPSFETCPWQPLAAPEAPARTSGRHRWWISSRSFTSRAGLRLLKRFEDRTHLTCSHSETRGRGRDGTPSRSSRYLTFMETIKTGVVGRNSRSCQTKQLCETKINS